MKKRIAALITVLLCGYAISFAANNPLGSEAYGSPVDPGRGFVNPPHRVHVYGEGIRSWGRPYNPNSLGGTSLSMGFPPTSTAFGNSADLSGSTTNITTTAHISGSADDTGTGNLASSAGGTSA